MVVSDLGLVLFLHFHSDFLIVQHTHILLANASINESSNFIFCFTYSPSLYSIDQYEQ
jgi:hypothetical protein